MDMMAGSSGEVVCLIGDGEANEGTFWESLLLMQKFPETRLSILLDANGSSERAIPIIDAIGGKRNCFRTMAFKEVEGHDVEAIKEALEAPEHQKFILCRTDKGYPCKTLIGNPIWHHRVPNENEYKALVGELTDA